MPEPDIPEVPPNPAEDARDWSAEKTRLEVTKLRMDLHDYSQQLALQQKKLKADARDWAYKLGIGVATTLLGVLTFTGVQLYQRQSDARKSANDAISQRDSRARQYDANFAIRTTAISALVPFLQPIRRIEQTRWFERIWPGTGEEIKIEEKDEQARTGLREDIVRAIALRLVVESDVRALEEDSRALTTVGIYALAAAARSNRIAMDDFERSSGDYIASFVHGSDSEECDTSQAATDALKSLDDLITRARMPFETDFENGGDASGHATPIGLEGSHFNASLALRNFGVYRISQLECHYQVESGRTSQTSSKRKSVETLIRSAQSLAVSSLTIVRIVRELGSNRKPLNLNGTFIVNGLHADIDFSKSSLRNAYIAGAPATFKCLGCDLSNADLRDLKLNPGSDFSGADLYSTHFQAPISESVVVEDKWRNKALQYPPECRFISFHLDVRASCPKAERPKSH